MGKTLGPTGEFFKRRDEWRKHPMLGLQQGLRPFLLSPSSTTIFFSLSLRSGVDFQCKEQSLDIVMFQFPSVVCCNKLHTDI
ncbi:hypothetical protein V6N13_011469 [Hibiscus sabdariffa]|uniref:Uncharacterized protein n=1 Tax=Hibiscus sabdariffa TaxID=183260 RepID=A0ABR2SCY3_9ROSI